MSQQDQQHPNITQPERSSGFRFVDVVGDDWKGYINLFWGDQPLALVAPPMATAIRSEIVAQPSTVPAGFRYRVKSLGDKGDWHYVPDRAPNSDELEHCQIQAVSIQAGTATESGNAAMSERLANLSRLLRRVTSELKDLNDSIRGEIDEDMADPDGESEMCDATDDLVHEAQLYLASLPADA